MLSVRPHGMRHFVIWINVGVEIWGIKKKNQFHAQHALSSPAVLSGREGLYKNNNCVQNKIKSQKELNQEKKLVFKENRQCLL